MNSRLANPVILVLVLLGPPVGVGAQRSDSAQALLRVAMDRERVDGDLAGAIEQYQAIVNRFSGMPDVAAEALVHMAACYDKLGQTGARATYERVVREYPNQKRAVMEARAWLAAHPVSAGPPAGVRVEQVWTGAGVNLEGRVTRDGRYLTFADWTSGPANLAVRDLKTGENRLLTRGASNEAFAENPLPSPDGKRIAYRWGETEKNSTIRLIRLDGTDMRILAHDRHENYLVAWSPDGRYLAATRVSGADNTAQIVLISTDDGSVKQLKSTAWPAPDLGGFSPDGRFLVYAVDKDSKTGDGGVFAIATDASRDVPVVRGSADFSSPTWSPDGGRVLFTSDRSGTTDLWSIRIADGKAAEAQPELLRNSVGNITLMGFGDDGALYYGTREVQSEAYSAEFDPEALTIGVPTLITDQFAGRNASPELSPDAQYVAFLRRPGRPGAGSVAVRSLATGEERTLTTFQPAYGARILQWFPDGRSLLIHDADGSQKKRLRKVNLQSGEVAVLFEAPWRLWTTALSVDGRSLFYSIKEDGPGEFGTLRLVKRQLDTGAETEIYRTQSSPGAGLFGLSASPDGTQLAFAVNLDYSHRAVMTIPTAGGSAREVRRFGYDAAPLPLGPMSWTKDGRHLVVTLAREPGNQQVAALPLDGGDIRLLGVRMPTILTRSLSADGRRIAFTGSTNKQELWVIRNLLTERVRMR